jgi:hypothetical protein
MRDGNGLMPELVQAVVHVGAVETVYLRGGRGDSTCVVLAEADAERMRLMRRFGEHGRVVAPVPPWPTDSLRPAATAAWLRGVIDGLGLDRPGIVLAADLSALADELARTSPEIGDVIIAALEA